jgi:hypothetical protein
MLDMMTLHNTFQSDYGVMEYGNIVQTSSLANGKVWAEKYPRIAPATRFEEELAAAIDEWLAELESYIELLREQAKSTDARVVAEGRTKKATLQNRTSTAKRSLEQTGHFLPQLLPHLRLDFMPAVSIDNEGEVDFEWYGRLGARASITIGANGVLYFVSLFHGQSLKSRLTWSSTIPSIILTELDKIYKDKTA